MNRTDGAVAAALAEAHRALLTDLRELERSAQPPSAAGADEVSARLGGLRTHLEDHFRFEEHNGYMQAVLARAPHLERAVNQLRGEHGELRRSLVALAEEAGGARALGADFRQKVRKWIERVRDHEMRENVLVAEAFHRDVAAED
jgi:hypothetical protein